jgi:hypothetical protein
MSANQDNNNQLFLSVDDDPENIVEQKENKLVENPLFLSSDLPLSQNTSRSRRNSKEDINPNVNLDGENKSNAELGSTGLVTVQPLDDSIWKEEQEIILKKWSDKGLCFKLMHERAYKRFWCLNAWFNIPVIIISTITGTGNFASSALGGGSSNFIFILGGLNIFSGILATINTYVGVAQKMEGHRFSSSNWDKFTRKIQIELAQLRSDRVKVKTFLKQCAEEYNRLIEMSPIIPNDIIKWFTTVIETGDYYDDLGDIESCVFECCCFPCGCTFCKIFSCSCCCPRSNTEKQRDLRETWKELELPDVLGHFKPTGIADETRVNIPGHH